MSKARTFEAVLLRPEGIGTWTFVDIPFEVEAAFGGGRARVPVKGTIDGSAFRSSLMPQGGGRFILVVNGALREAIGKSAGQSVTVTLEPDTGPREVELPAEFSAALVEHEAAREAFAVLSYSHQKEYADWIASAKRAETRMARVAKALEMIVVKRRLKG